MEREWQAYHQAVTVLHRYTSITELLAATIRYFANRSRSYAQACRFAPWTWKQALSSLQSAQITWKLV